MPPKHSRKRAKNDAETSSASKKQKHVPRRLSIQEPDDKDYRLIEEDADAVARNYQRLSPAEWTPEVLEYYKSVFSPPIPLDTNTNTFSNSNLDNTTIVDTMATIEEANNVLVLIASQRTELDKAIMAAQETLRASLGSFKPLSLEYFDQFSDDRNTPARIARDLAAYKSLMTSRDEDVQILNDIEASIKVEIDAGSVRVATLDQAKVLTKTAAACAAAAAPGIALLKKATDAVAAIKKQRTATAASLAEADKQRSGAHDAHNAAHQAWWEEGELTGEWKDTVLRAEYIVRVIKDDDKNLAAAEKVLAAQIASGNFTNAALVPVVLAHDNMPEFDAEKELEIARKEGGTQSFPPVSAADRAEVERDDE